ncbi:MAG: zinc-ribbon domain-containing protein, partial [Lachnospiraceae bacterium]|nr:zinc-ribbon domain-containing protein [Lachnospiraceae bacterium]
MIKKEIIKNYSEYVRVFECPIPRSVRASEISALGISIYKHAPGSKVERAYGCPLCKDGHAYTGSMDILTAKPELAAKWDYERNKRDASTYAAGSRFLVWWKGSCGHSYRAVIRDMYRGMPCPICERRKERNIPEKALIYYLKRMKIRYETNHQDITGLPLELFLPDDRAAVECWEEAQETDYAYARERCKNIACIQAGIKMIRILPRKARTYDNCLCILRKDKSIKSLEQAIAVSLRAIGIYNKTVDINLARDMKMVKIIPFERMLL